MFAWTAPHLPQIPVASAGVPARLEVFDAVDRGPEAVGPVDGTARMYVCGITPYDATHLGHANTYLAFDLLNRVWRDLGLTVVYAQNVTDVDEPLLERAEATGVEWQDLAADQIALFRSDMEALRVLPPDHFVGAVESVPDVITLLEHLRDHGQIYQVDDPDFPDWYFDVTQSPEFGTVGHLDADAMRAKFATMGGDPDRTGKRNPLDCLVWRLHREGEPSWASSLGEGRPGWHIECTAIALRHLGTHFDVQGGGTDLAFPHHEMCAAQALVATGDQLALAFVHSGMVALDGEKMSKSKGNLELVSRLRQQGADPMAIRLAVHSHHYRADWEWTPDQLDAATARLARWREAATRPAGASFAPVLAAVRTALRNDLDAPVALSILDQWVEQTLAGEAVDEGAGALFVTTVDALFGIALADRLQ